MWNLVPLHDQPFRYLCNIYLELLLFLTSRQAGHRVGEHLERIIPLIVKFCKIDEDDELREYCIQVSRMLKA